MPSANLSLLKQAFLDEIETISDTLIKARARYYVDRMIDAYEKQSALENNEIASYTVMNRTFTRRNVTEGREVIYELEADLRTMIYGSVTLADINLGTTT